MNHQNFKKTHQRVWISNLRVVSFLKVWEKKEGIGFFSFMKIVQMSRVGSRGRHPKCRPKINYVLPSEIWQMISSVAGSIVGKVFLLMASTNWLLINIWVNLICGFDMILLKEILEHANYQYPQERNLDKSYWNYVTKLVFSINVDTPVVSWITPETSLSNCHLHSLF